MKNASSAVQQLSKDLDWAFTYKVDKPVAVYRGARVNLNTGKLELNADAAYISTSVDPAVARNFSSHETIMRIILREGQELIPINGDSSYSTEKEFILPRGSKFRVVGSRMERVAGTMIRVLECEVER